MGKGVRRLEKQVPSGAQRGFSFAGEASSPPASPVGMRGAPVFKKGRRDQLFVGDVKLDKYLAQAGLGWVLRMQRLLDDVGRFLAPAPHPFRPLGDAPHRTDTRHVA